jgi:hypothetical protein
MKNEGSSGLGVTARQRGADAAGRAGDEAIVRA